MNIIIEIFNIDNETPTIEKEELEILLNTILEHNYMQLNDQFYNQNEGLAMGAPTSAILAEIFIQYLEHTKIVKILDKHQIIDYHRHVHDVFIIYNKNIANIESTLNEYNTLHKKINVTIEKEIHNTLNYLDLTITNSYNKLTFGIYRKPTNTDLILHKKYLAITYLVNRMTKYPITHENKILELNTINEILVNNHYRQHITTTALNQHSSPKNPRNATTKNEKKNGPLLHIMALERELLQDHLKILMFKYHLKQTTLE
jgi:hypothetical protein